MSTIPKGARDFLATGPLAHVVTLNPDGTPHVSLAWAGVDDDGGIELYRAKYRELHAHWGLDFTQTALDFSVPIRIQPTRVRLG